ncbi:DUF6545 domain-containing protein, partial [Pseudonocardia hydrocarbonoxydans]|uniref:DUF6545 domain-containing protein n=2 Tax=Pseudonocardia hydrocarbonoxydans TaxID=76726 RepID=UPI0031DAE5B4
TAPSWPMTQPRSVRHSLGRTSADLRLYRRVIEIRDALLVLQHRVDGPIVEAARSHVRAEGPEIAIEPAVVACWLAVALEAPRGQANTSGWSVAPEAPAENAWASEIAFQLQLAWSYRQPFVAAFARSIRQPVVAGERPTDRIRR